MRILLDECVPRALKRKILGHSVLTVHEAGWAGKKNGELLHLMHHAGISVLLTADRNMNYQQNLGRPQISLIVMVAPTNRPEDLLPLIPSVLAVLNHIAPGERIEVGGDTPSN